MDLLTLLQIRITLTKKNAIWVDAIYIMRSSERQQRWSFSHYRGAAAPPEYVKATRLMQHTADD